LFGACAAGEAGDCVCEAGACVTDGVGAWVTDGVGAWVTGRVGAWVAGPNRLRGAGAGGADCVAGVGCCVWLGAVDWEARGAVNSVAARPAVKIGRSKFIRIDSFLSGNLFRH
jgi:hypothetical protein